MNAQEKLYYAKRRLVEIYTRKHPPETKPFLAVLKSVNKAFKRENLEIRPSDRSGLPGGIINLNQNIPTMILSDIHARIDYLINILFIEDTFGYTTLDKISLGLLQIVCVGDGLHSEFNTAERWAAAFQEYKDAFTKHKNIDEEMREGFGVMEIIMELKRLYPKHFHFLKGNHENITDEKDNGNRTFAKYAHEGPMIEYYVKKFYDEKVYDQYNEFEKNLPIFAIGKNFLISHAEPLKFFSRQEILEYRIHPKVVHGLTWTDDDDAEKGSVEKMLKSYIKPEYLKESYYFGGHRPVKELFNPRANGKYIQFHNPCKFMVCVIRKDREINLNKDIIEIKGKIKLVDDPNSANVDKQFNYK